MTLKAANFFIQIVLNGEKLRKKNGLSAGEKTYRVSNANGARNTKSSWPQELSKENSGARISKPTEEAGSTTGTKNGVKPRGKSKLSRSVTTTFEIFIKIFINIKYETTRRL